jgi:hypothetical protein
MILKKNTCQARKAPRNVFLAQHSPTCRARRRPYGFLFFFKSTPKAYHNFIEGRGLSTRTPPLVASNKRSNNSTPASLKTATPTKQQHNMKELVLSYTTKPHLDRRRTPPKNSNSKRTLLADAPSKEEKWWNSLSPEKASSWTRQQ